MEVRGEVMTEIFFLFFPFSENNYSELEGAYQLTDIHRGQIMYQEKS
jgi:hypothetical protein